MTFAARRQSHRPLTERSIDHAAHLGRESQHTVIENFGLAPRMRSVQAVVRGSHIGSSPLHEEKTSLVSAGRLPIYARSGNEDDHHQQPWEGQSWGMVGDLTPAEIAAQESSGSAKALAIGVVGFIGLMMVLGK